MMKKKMMMGFVLGTVVMAAVPALASETEDFGEMTGAYEAYHETGLSDEAREAFDQAIAKYEGGENLTPVQMISSQLVAGMNYRILCEKKTDDGSACKVMITVYKDLSGNCEVTDEKKVITPLNEDEKIEGDDFSMHASFEAEDFDWENRTLTFELYDDALYDMVDMSQMEVGDFVEVDGECIQVETKNEETFTRTDADGNEEKVSAITINKDSAYEQHFVANEGGTWIVTQLDDHVACLPVGKKTLPLSETLILKDLTASCEPVEISVLDLQDYLNGNTELEPFSKHFSPYNTRIEAENGVITGIERTYMP